MGLDRCPSRLDGGMRGTQDGGGERGLDRGEGRAAARVILGSAQARSRAVRHSPRALHTHLRLSSNRVVPSTTPFRNDPRTTSLERCRSIWHRQPPLSRPADVGPSASQQSQQEVNILTSTVRPSPRPRLQRLGTLPPCTGVPREEKQARHAGTGPSPPPAPPATPRPTHLRHSRAEPSHAERGPAIVESVGRRVG